MDVRERILFLKKSILINDEQLAHWMPWHCRRLQCKKHMCKVRSKAIQKLNIEYIQMARELDNLEYQVKMDLTK